MSISKKLISGNKFLGTNSTTVRWILNFRNEILKNKTKKQPQTTALCLTSSDYLHCVNCWLRKNRLPNFHPNVLLIE